MSQLTLLTFCCCGQCTHCIHLRGGARSKGRGPGQNSSTIGQILVAGPVVWTCCCAHWCSAYYDYAVLTPAHSKLLNALQVYLASASPPVRYPNVYGVDMPTKKEFVATDLSEEEIRKVNPCALWSANYVAMLSLGCNRQVPTSET